MSALTSVSFLVPAAGCGARSGLSGNKILAPLHARPVLFWTLRALAQPNSTPLGCVLEEILVAARREEWSLIEPIFTLFESNTRARMRLVEGGATRQDSVQALVQCCRGDIVAIHDAARPLVEPELCARVVQAAVESGAAMAALPASDTIKIASEPSQDGQVLVERTLDRRLIWLAQTPQAFGRGLLLRALEVARGHGFQGTDCASLFEHWRELEPQEDVPRVRLVEGSARNFKITFAADLERAGRELNEEE